MPRNLFERPRPLDVPRSNRGGSRSAPPAATFPSPQEWGRDRRIFSPAGQMVQPFSYGTYLPTVMKPAPTPYDWLPNWMQPWNNQVGPPVTQPTVGGSAAVPYDTYLPTVMRGAPLHGYANADPFLTNLYTPQVGGASVGVQAQLGGNMMGDRSGLNSAATRSPSAPTTPGGRVEQQYAPAPPNVDAAWYKQFQVEHDGETPEKFYARTGEGLDEALADREWGDRFARMMGRAPTEWDWEEHWYSTRAYGRPQGNPGPGWRRKSKRGATDDIKRPPLYVPPQTSWRL